MSLVVEVRVVPSSGKQLFMLGPDDTLKIYLKSSPEKGRANAELVKILAKALGITRVDVQIIAGATSRKKLIRLSLDSTFDQLLQRLGIERQRSLF
jgi:uncharacterized protein (TIGR00251 family)